MSQLVLVVSSSQKAILYSMVKSELASHDLARYIALGLPFENYPNETQPRGFFLSGLSSKMISARGDPALNRNS